jgi:hypothetical protein
MIQQYENSDSSAILLTELKAMWQLLQPIGQTIPQIEKEDDDDENDEPKLSDR